MSTDCAELHRVFSLIYEKIFLKDSFIFTVSFLGFVL